MEMSNPYLLTSQQCHPGQKTNSEPQFNHQVDEDDQLALPGLLEQPKKK